MVTKPQSVQFREATVKFPWGSNNKLTVVIRIENQPSHIYIYIYIYPVVYTPPPCPMANWSSGSLESWVIEWVSLARVVFLVPGDPFWYHFVPFWLCWGTQWHPCASLLSVFWCFWCAFGDPWASCGPRCPKRCQTWASKGQWEHFWWDFQFGAIILWT